MAARYSGNRKPKQRLQAKTACPIESNLLAKELYSPSEEKDSLVPKPKNNWNEDAPTMRIWGVIHHPLQSLPPVG
jgi:hypothetical protein